MDQSGTQVNFLKGEAGETELSEFEGCLIAELGRLQPCTAYQLRRSFLASPSQSWSGSAGAVSPAVRRLAADGLIRSETDTANRRGGARLSLTDTGESTRRAWISDAARAADSGFDPFRTRVTLLDSLPADQRAAFIEALREGLERRIAGLEQFVVGKDPVTQARAGIDMAQQRFRLEWLASNAGTNDRGAAD